MGSPRRSKIEQRAHSAIVDNMDEPERPTSGDEMREALARQRKVAQRSNRRGRASTVLTQRDGGSLG